MLKYRSGNIVRYCASGLVYDLKPNDCAFPGSSEAKISINCENGKEALVVNGAPRDGDFLRIYDDGNSAEILQTSDRPDRTLFLTPRCNSACLMCPYTQSMRQTEEDIPIDFFHRCIELMNPFSPYLCVTGGEPTLRGEAFFSVLRAIKARFKNALTHILTNGRAFYYSDFVLDYVKSRPCGTLLGIPLHAADADCHDRISRSPGSFLQTTSAIERLLALGERVELRVVVSNLNINSLMTLAEFIAERYNRVHTVCFMGMEMMGSAIINKTSVWTPLQRAAEMSCQAAELLADNGISSQLYNFPLCFVPERFHSIYRKSISYDKVEYLPGCDECFGYDLCGGFFRSTIRMPGIYEIHYQ